jgi:hypothetical protein
MGSQFFTCRPYGTLEFEYANPGTNVPGYELATLRDSKRLWVNLPGTEVPGYFPSPLRG